jgi:hypothetical protein
VPIGLNIKSFVFFETKFTRFTKKVFLKLEQYPMHLFPRRADHAHGYAVPGVEQKYSWPRVKSRRDFQDAGSVDAIGIAGLSQPCSLAIQE